MQIDVKVLDERVSLARKPGDAGQDLQACAGFLEGGTRFRFADGEEADIHPGETIMIGTGIAIHIKDPRYCGLIYARSGLGAKHGLIPRNAVGVIDSGYQGEIVVALTNTGTQPYVIQPLERIAQLVIAPIVVPAWNVVDSFPPSDRAAGGFGSSGR